MNLHPNSNSAHYSGLDRKVVLIVANLNKAIKFNLTIEKSHNIIGVSWSCHGQRYDCCDSCVLTKLFHMSLISVKEFDSLQSYSQSLLTVAVNSELLLYTFCVC